MHFSPSHRSRGAVDLNNALAPHQVDQPHAVTVADIAVACAALDYGCATWSSHQVDVVVARDEEGDLAAKGRLPHNGPSR
jgi:hypothetical protein